MIAVDHVTRGLSRLIDKFKRKPGVVGLVTALLDEVQELSDAIYYAYAFRQLADAFGAGLDQWGLMFGLRRQGLSDDDYRIHLQVRLLILHGSGTAPELLTIFTLLAPSPRTVSFIARYPAGFEILISTEASLEGDELADILATARGGGIDAQMRWSSEPLTATFTTEGGGGLGVTTLASLPTGGILGRAREA